MQATATVSAFSRRAGIVAPSEMSGLVADWDASVGVTVTGQGVSSWLGLNGHNLEQTTDANRPLVVAADPDFNGQQSFNFDGTNDRLIDFTASITTSLAHTWYVVLRSDLDDTSSRAICGSETGRLDLMWSITTNTHSYLTGTNFPWATSSPEANVTQDLIFVFDSVAQTARLYEAGTDRGTVAYTATKQVTGAFAVGAIFNGGALFFDGRIARVGVYNRALSAIEANNLHTYLDARYVP